MTTYSTALAAHLAPNLAPANHTALYNPKKATTKKEGGAAGRLLKQTLALAPWLEAAQPHLVPQTDSQAAQVLLNPQGELLGLRLFDSVSQAEETPPTNSTKGFFTHIFPNWKKIRNSQV